MPASRASIRSTPAEIRQIQSTRVRSSSRQAAGHAVDRPGAGTASPPSSPRSATRTPSLAASSTSPRADRHRRDAGLDPAARRASPPRSPRSNASARSPRARSGSPRAATRRAGELARRGRRNAAPGRGQPLRVACPPRRGGDLSERLIAQREALRTAEAQIAPARARGRSNALGAAGPARGARRAARGAGAHRPAGPDRADRRRGRRHQRRGRPAGAARSSRWSPSSRAAAGSKSGSMRPPARSGSPGRASRSGCCSMPSPTRNMAPAAAPSRPSPACRPSPTNLDPNLGIEEPVFRIRVRIDEMAPRVPADQRAMRPGMTLNANLVLERRSLWEVLFGPIRSARAADERDRMALVAAHAAGAAVGGGRMRPRLAGDGRALITATASICRACASVIRPRSRASTLEELMAIASDLELAPRALRLELDELDKLQQAGDPPLGPQPFRRARERRRAAR